MHDHVTYRVWPYSRWKVANTFIFLPLLLTIAIVILHESLFRLSPHLFVLVVVAIFVVVKYITGGERLTLTPTSLIFGKKSIDPSRVSSIDVNDRKVSIRMQNGKRRVFRLFKSSDSHVQQFVNDLQNYVWKYGIEVRVFTAN